MALSFNLEDKVRWEEWAPSLQDKLKALLNKWQAGYAWAVNYAGATRISIGPTAPQNCVKYADVWWDTRYHVARVLTNEGWILTRGAWYQGANTDVEDTIESPKSHNPTTRCHCYTINWDASQYCHCKTQGYIPTETNKTTNTGFQNHYGFQDDNYREFKTGGYFAFDTTAVPSGKTVEITSLNFTSVQFPQGVIKGSTDPSFNRNSKLYTPISYTNTDKDNLDPSNLFDDNKSTSFTIPSGKYYKVFLRINPDVKIGEIGNIFGTLKNNSSGPITIHFYLQKISSANEYVKVFSITLLGNYDPGLACHSNCHCARW